MKKSYYIDRVIDLACHAFRVSPSEVIQFSAGVDIGQSGFCRQVGTALIHKLLIEALGRRAESGLLCDDRGHARDFRNALKESSRTLFGPSGGEIFDGALTALVGEDRERFFSADLFSAHIERFSGSRRKAPVCWQLATASGRYSVWCFAQTATRDTIFKIQNEFAGPKLAHEERRFDAMRRDSGPSPNASERKALASQETLIDGLRQFLEELKRVAPIWSPNLDDGVIINFAPLWRLVPHSKPWQKELKATWDSLCDGEFDWAHLAMHLWPERVVPKCASDRSLAIAHGLEDVFWLEGGDGKWKPRPTAARPIEDLVRERTSSAVKVALKSLLEAPVATTGGGRGRGRRAASAAVDGGIR